MFNCITLKNYSRFHALYKKKVIGICSQSLIVTAFASNTMKCIQSTFWNLLHITQCSPVAIMHFILALSFYSHSSAPYRSRESKISIQLVVQAHISLSLRRHTHRPPTVWSLTARCILHTKLKRTSIGWLSATSES